MMNSICPVRFYFGLEDMAYNIAEQCYNGEDAIVTEYFQVLQHIVSNWDQEYVWHCNSYACKVKK